nr:uncharacterized protein LOC115266060 [Aedes albopictus]
MDLDNFRNYVEKIFYPYLVEKNVELPVIFFVDGHSSHKSVEVADLCQSLGIILISLYPNTTHITQPADVSVFKPLKDEYRRQAEYWRLAHPDEILTVTHFGEVLTKTVAQGIKASSIRNGFRVCGLFPFNPDNVDYSKCIARKCNNSRDSRDPSINDAPQAPTEIEPVQLSQPELLMTTVVDPSMISPLDSSSVSLQTEEQHVSIHINKIIQAVDMIGPQTMTKIQGDVGLLSREERTIRFFYQEFVQPYVSISNCDRLGGEDVNTLNTTSNTLTPSTVGELAVLDDEILMCAIAETSNNDGKEPVLDTIENLRHENTPIVIEVPGDTSNQSFDIPWDTENVIYCQLNNASDSSPENTKDANSALGEDQTMCLVDFEDEQHRKSNENVFEKDQDLSPLPETVLKDSSNKTKPGCKRRLSEVFKLPPTPRRSTKHRKYSMKFYPVLTAKERLDEIQKKEDEKQAIANLKLKRAKDREMIKQQREDLKKAKAAERERKKIEREQKKEQKKELTKSKTKGKRAKQPKLLI